MNDLPISTPAESPGQALSASPLSVSELTAQIKQLIEQGFSHIKVSGEVSRLTARAGGHIYFTIKDAHAALAAVIWKSTALRLAARPEEGRQYVFHGHLSLYPPQGRYQLVVTRIEEAGSGALAAEFERRKRLFAERGWFDAARKRPVPALPQHIGIVTSSTAAALQDVKKVLSTRPGWLTLTLAPTQVQGQAAVAGIVGALKRLQGMDKPPDVILLVRGGGSPEDLWCFNDEAVVSAVVDCAIPVISGIGHDIDTTLADFAADLRAATPSNAAELACPASETLRRQMPRIGLLQQLVQHQLRHARRGSEQTRTALALRWRSQRDEQRMRLDRLAQQAEWTITRQQQQRWQRLRQLEKRLLPQEPGQRLRLRQRRLDESRQQLQAAAERHTQHMAREFDLACRRLQQAGQRLVPETRARLAIRRGQLHALGPISVLRRGYTLATAPDGRLVRSAQDIATGDRLCIRFHDGSADTEIRQVHHNKEQLP